VRQLAVIVVLVIYTFVACDDDAATNRDFDDEAGGGGNTAAPMGAGGQVGSNGGMGGVNTTTSAQGGDGGGGAPVTTTGPGCMNDGAEPNNSEATATDLGTFDDCDASGDVVSGVLPQGDEDWFVFTGTDALQCASDASRTVVANGTVRICKFFEGVVDCNGLSFTCPAGTTTDTSPGGRSGCCSTSDFEVSLGCGALPGFAQVDVYIRLDTPPSESCVSYTLDYHY
jgi:hypothetical protein